jgi:hypothetical protein
LLVFTNPSVCGRRAVHATESKAVQPSKLACGLTKR